MKKLPLIFFFFGLSVISGNLIAQKFTSWQKSDGITKISLLSGDKTFITVPASLPGLVSNRMGNERQTEYKGTNLFNWTLKYSKPGKVFKDISFADPLVGYIVTELGSVYKTVDGGENWVSKMNLGFPYYWYGVHALSPDTVVISGFNNQGQINEGVVRWTYDGGDTWGSDLILAIPVNGVGWLERVHFFNHDTGIVFDSFSGGCWITSNGGKEVSSWTYITINEDLGWIAGNIDAQPGGLVYATGIHFAKSSDFGNSWSSYPSADNVFDSGVDFLDVNNLLGWTGGGQISAPVTGWIHRTTNGGDSWGPRLETFPYPVRAVGFFNASTGIAIGGDLYQESGGIYSTADSGNTWSLDKSTSAEMFSYDYKIISVDSMDIWCVGSTGGGTGFTGKLYKARTGNLVTGVQDNGSLNSTFSWLGQNVPNPFSQETTVRFFIPYPCFTSLKVFDIFGKEMMTLVNGFQTQGYQSVKFEPAGFTNGLYYYQLRAGNHIETKKLILNK